MALVLGELATILKADLAPFERDLRKARRAFDQHKDALKAGAAVAGAAIAAGIGAGLVSAMNLSSAQAKLKNQLGDPAVAEAAGAAAAGSFGRGFTATIDEAMADASAVFSSGLTGGSQNEQLIEDLTVKTQALSKTFEFDLAKAAGVAGVVMRDGLAKDGTEALDLIARTSQRVGPQFREDILDAAHEYGTFFASLGFDGPQAFELLARGAEKGTYGIDKIADTIKELTLIATDMSTGTQEAFGEIGLDAHQMANDLLAGGDTAQAAFGKIISGLQDIKDPADRANTAIALFGTPLEDMNKADIPEFLDSLSNLGDGMTDAAGTASEMAETFEQDAGQQLQAFKNQVQAALVDKLAEAVPYMRATFGWLSENSDWVGPLTTGLGVLAGAIALIIGALKVWAAVQIVLNLALWTSPITWIVLGVLALIAVIVLIATKTTWFSDLWNWAWNGIKGAALKTWDWLKSLPGKMKEAYSNLANIITAPFRNAFNAIARLWNGGPGRMSFTVPDWIPKFGGRGFSMPTMPMLAKGGNILEAGMAIVGEAGPEMLHLPRGAQVEPLRGGGRNQHAEQRVTLIIRGDGVVAGIREDIRLKGGGDVVRHLTPQTGGGWS
ncbi:phage-related minor tail protein [Micromonospora sp. Llam0]|uniref:phage tail protein n=1 Tax=Micromonospora sp. Llam0 TaxID=2485143 RepID=UPI000F487560|nr:phage tail protein [Micromonospora sp. Llam0]ROO51082.1 phage-related minor tail protein [Micromonospora sp. Llam0]